MRVSKSSEVSILLILTLGIFDRLGRHFNDYHYVACLIFWENKGIPVKMPGMRQKMRRVALKLCINGASGSKNKQRAFGTNKKSKCGVNRKRETF